MKKGEKCQIQRALNSNIFSMEIANDFSILKPSEGHFEGCQFGIEISLINHMIFIFLKWMIFSSYLQIFIKIV